MLEETLAILKEKFKSYFDYTCILSFKGTIVPNSHTNSTVIQKTRLKHLHVEGSVGSYMILHIYNSPFNSSHLILQHLKWDTVRGHHKKLLYFMSLINKDQNAILPRSSETANGESLRDATPLGRVVRKKEEAKAYLSGIWIFLSNICSLMTFYLKA